MKLVSGRGGFLLVGSLVASPAGSRLAATDGGPQSVEEAVLALNGEMTKAGEAADADFAICAAKDKAYFKIVNVPRGLKLASKKYSDGKLSLKFLF